MYTTSATCAKTACRSLRPLSHEAGRVLANSALLTDTFASPLRAQPGAAKRGRWPVQLYLILLRSSNVPRYRQYASSRTTFSLKEQFVITAFVWFFTFWFFIFLVAEAAMFSCGRQGC